MPIPVLESATFNDLPEIVQLLAQDALGQVRECPQDPLPACYEKAFRAIEKDPNSHLIVARLGGKVVGCLQLTFTPTLTHQGALRATVGGGAGGAAAASPGNRFTNAGLCYQTSPYSWLQNCAGYHR